MYRGTAIIEGAKVFIDYCLKEQLPFLFLTNNSGRTPRQAADHMLKIGYQGIEPKHFYTSAMAASDTMIRRFPDKKRAYMVGAEGLREALLNNGYELVDDQADLVFIGLDKEGTWEKYSLALRQVLAGADSGRHQQRSDLAQRSGSQLRQRLNGGADGICQLARGGQDWQTACRDYRRRAGLSGLGQR